MGYLKNRFLESVPSKEVDILLQKYQRESKVNATAKIVPELNEEQLKMLDRIIDCQIEDAKIKKDEKG